MKLASVILITLFIVGCAPPSTIVFDSNKKVTTVTNYIIADGPSVYTPNIPDNWFTSAWKQALDSVGPYIGIYKELIGGVKLPVTTPPVVTPPVRPYP